MRRTLLILVVAMWASGPARAANVRSLLVFPFENQSPRADLNWISESFAQVLSARLAKEDNYVLDREERNAAYTQLGMPADAPLSLASEFKVAETLGVDWAVVGGFDVAGQRLTARAQLLNLARLQLSHPLEVSGELAELVDLQTRLAWRLLATHDPSFTAGSEDEFRRRFHDVRLDAFENYIRGLLATDDAARARFFEDSDRLDPSDHRAAFALGRDYFRRKDYSESARWLAKVGEADPDHDESLFLRGVDEFFLGHESLAEKDFEALVRVLPLNEVANDLGVLQARRGQYAEALANFERACESDPSDADFCFNQGVAFWFEQRYADAAQTLRAALGASPDDPEIHTLLAMVLGKLDDRAGERQQRDWLAEHEGVAASARPEDILPLPRIKKNYDGRAFRLLEITVHNAREQRLTQLSPQEHSEEHLTAGRKLLSARRFGEAERELGEAVSLLPSDPQARVLLAQALAGEGKNAEAARQLEASVRLKDTAEARLVLAQVYLAMNQPAQARIEGQAALALEPENVAVRQLLEQIPLGPPPGGKTP